MDKNLICICCPMGCHLKVNIEENKVSGNGCKRGIDYGISEITNPVRVITTTVKVKEGELPVLPVKTKGAIPTDHNSKCMEELKKLEVVAPVSVGEVILKDILGTGIDIVSCRDIKSIKA